jgi:hypothetical protein
MLELKVPTPLSSNKLTVEKLHLLKLPELKGNGYVFIQLLITPCALVKATVEYIELDQEGARLLSNGKPAEIKDTYYYNSETLEPYLAGKERTVIM